MRRFRVDLTVIVEAEKISDVDDEQMGAMLMSLPDVVAVEGHGVQDEEVDE